MFTQLRPAIIIFIALTLVTGFAYPLIVTGVVQVLFPRQANGSLLYDDDTLIGSELIGQKFDQPEYFWGRPSAIEYNAATSGGSNLGPTNPALLDAVKSRVEKLKAADPTNTLPVPVDLVTTSSSGLDPHITPAAATYQIGRVARARNVSVEKLQTLIEQHTEGRTFGVLGEPRVNVLLLNRGLDTME